MTSSVDPRSGKELPAYLTDLTAEEAIDDLWRKGILYWKLNSCQRQLYSKYRKRKDKIQVWNISRQVGKSYTLIILALETCLKTPNVQVKYCAGTQKAVAKIIKPTLKIILQECPKDLMPKYDRELGAYRFKNGSLLYIEGLDAGNAENLRGTPMHFGIVDEAGFVGDLEYIVNSILLPMTSTTKGRILIVSTPPKNSDHDFIKYLREAEFKGAYVKKTIWEYLEDVKDDPSHFRDRLTLDEVLILKANTKPDAWNREYECKIVTDLENAVIPEFNDESEDEIVKEWPRPQRYEIYHSMDLGLKDLTFVIFGYLDFKESKFIIEDEFICNGRHLNSTFIGNGIQKKHEELYYNSKTDLTPEPYKQISDNNEQIALNEMNRAFDFKFIPTRKDDKDAAINNLRILIQDRKIIINPRCKNLIFHLKNALWDKNRKSFVRSSDAGHFDGVDALIYLSRNIDWYRNPYPAGWGIVGDFFTSRKDEQLQGNAAVLNQMFKKIRKKA